MANTYEEKTATGVKLVQEGYESIDTKNTPSIVVPTVYDAGAGALPITGSIIALETGGAEALTLADGSEGQELTIIMTVDGGAGTVTPANFGNGTTLTFDDAGDNAVLKFVDGNWWTIGTPTATVA